MHYPVASEAQLAFFREHGYLVVRDAIPQAALDEIEAHCDTLIAEKDLLANDWAWGAKEERDRRSFRIVQSSPSYVWAADIATQPYRQWLATFASRLMQREMAF
ncbi:hypothetical protein ACFPME_06020 [Rhodanobacter umsongensis]|uniref:Phytanoyl-CoA dioxygenase n=1 Tax=Rhodanobacter umsongensis TaxID=633153 RepID=A0ABW0JK40_9GAMM